MVVLGISCFYHDSAAALIINGKVIAAAQEERFSRIKNDHSFPINAIKFCLELENLDLNDIDSIIFYDKPFLSFERILETVLSFWPFGFKYFLHSIPLWVKEKLLIRKQIQEGFSILGKVPRDKIKFSFHHLSHAASVYYTSSFKESAVLIIDGVGEWSSASIYKGEGNKLTLLKDLNYPHSLGLLYSSFTSYCGFKVNSGEYKLMGLAPYGDKESKQTKSFIKKIESQLIKIYDDGSLWMDMKYFRYNTDLKMFHEGNWNKLFNISSRDPDSEITQDYCNLAFAIQYVTEKIILKMSECALSTANSKNLCLAGGVALNCVANGVLAKSGLCEEIWIQPACGDAGGAMGAALAYYYSFSEKEESKKFNPYLGPSFSNESIKSELSNENYLFVEDQKELLNKIAKKLSHGKIIGWFQGRMEWGPRALGGRSILADPRSPDMQSRLNLKIKHRENFRPFAPAILKEDADLYFEKGPRDSYMLFTNKLKFDKRYEQKDIGLDLISRLAFKRSDLPAITHLDYSARLQIVEEDLNSIFYNLLKTFKDLTGIGALINTSFNVRGEPIVCSPKDALNCFYKTEMDILVLGNYIIYKEIGTLGDSD